MIRYLIEKEFKQIFRNPFVPRIVVGMTFAMMLVFPWAANQEIKRIKVAMVDNDRSTLSERFTHKAVSSGYFQLTDLAPTYRDALRSLEKAEADMIVEIPFGFERHLIKEGASPMLIAVNGVNGVKGSLGTSYMAATITDYTADLREEYKQSVAITAAPALNLAPLYKFNPNLDYKVFMVPALMVMLMTLITGFLPALNIVGEKEAGTMEQINVTPVSKPIFIISKLIPYWVIGLVVITLCIGLAASVYGLKPQGSLLTIYLFAAIYILTVSGLGLVISNYSNTMQQALFVSFFFLIIFILMSGLFTPITSMPEWAQRLTYINPLKYFMQVMRLVYLKGSSFSDLTTQFFTLAGFAFFLNLWAVVSYRKSS